MTSLWKALKRFLKIAFGYGPCDNCSKLKPLSWIHTKREGTVIRPVNDVKKYTVEYKGWLCTPCWNETMKDMDAFGKWISQEILDHFNEMAREREGSRR